MNFFNNIVLSDKNTKNKSTNIVSNVRTILDSDSFFRDIIINKYNNPKINIKPRLNRHGKFDIYYLHYSVLEYLSNNNTQIQKFDVTKLEWISENDPDPTERRIAKEKLFEYRENTEDPISSYLVRSTSIIREITRLCNISKIIDFYNKEKNVEENIEILKNIQNFISICQEYAPIAYNYSPALTIISRETDDEEIIKTLDITSISKGQKYSNNQQKYHNVKHFQTCIRKVQGIHRKEIPVWVFTKIREYNVRHKSLEFTIFDLDKLLKLDKNLSIYYKDIHLIYRLYTGIQTINISDLEDRLIEMYIDQDNISDMIKLKENSKNSINATYICCRIAQFLGRKDLKMADFFCTKSSNTILKYDVIMERRAKYLGWLDEFTDFYTICK